jgi:hypothetical protein
MILVIMAASKISLSVKTEIKFLLLECLWGGKGAPPVLGGLGIEFQWR